MSEREPTVKNFFEKEDKLFSEVLGISGEETRRLMKRIADTGGHIRVVMHPNSIEQPPGSLDKNAYKNFLAHLSKLFMQHAERHGSTCPTFLCVDRGEIIFKKGDGSIVHQREFAPLGLYVLQTEQDSGQPARVVTEAVKEYLLADNNRSLPAAEKHVEAWSSLGLLFRFLGVHSMTVSGGYVGAEAMKASRCLGAFIRVMRHFGYKVDISNSVVYRDGVTRNTLKYLDIPLKETGKKRQS